MPRGLLLITANNPHTSSDGSGAPRPPHAANGECEHAARRPITEEGQGSVEGKGVQGSKESMQNRQRANDIENHLCTGLRSRNSAVWFGPVLSLTSMENLGAEAGFGQ